MPLVKCPKCAKTVRIDDVAAEAVVCTGCGAALKRRATPAVPAPLMPPPLPAERVAPVGPPVLPPPSAVAAVAGRPEPRPIRSARALPRAARLPAEPAQKKRRRPKLDPAVLGAAIIILVAAAAALMMFFILVGMIRGTETGERSFVSGLLPSVPLFLFAGFFVAALTTKDRLWQVFYASLYLPLVSLCLQLFFWAALALIFGQLYVAREGSASINWAVLGPILWQAFLGAMLYGAITFLGGCFHALLVKWSKAPEHAGDWQYKTQDGRRIEAADPARAPFLVGLYGVIAYLFLIGSVPLCVLLLPLLCGLILFVSLRQLGKRRQIRTAREELRRDARPPIVYLRSFDDDGRHPDEGWLRRLNFGLKGLLAPTLEQRLAKTLEGFGPFVAIGKPGEEMIDVGAGRMYVSDDDWQAVVLDLVSQRGAMVVFQAGGSAGLQWELHNVARLMRPEQVVIFLPFAVDGSPGLAEQQYAQFRAWAAECLPLAELPERFEGRGAFLYFDADWGTHFLTPTKNVPRRHPLVRVLESFQSTTTFRPQPLFKLSRDWWRLALLTPLLPVFVWVVYLNVSIFRDQRERALANSPASALIGTPAPQPAPPALTEYTGRAFPYRLRLRNEWVAVPQPKKADREFNIPGGTSLVIIAAEVPIDLATTAKGFATRLGGKEGKVVVLEDKRIDHKGQTWAALKLQVTINQGTAWMYLRLWSGPKHSIQMFAVVEQDTDANRALIHEAVDSFELPIDIAAKPKD